MKASPASTLRNTDLTERIKSSRAGERKTEHMLYSVFQKPSFVNAPTILWFAPVVYCLGRRGYPLTSIFAAPIKHSLCSIALRRGNRIWWNTRCTENVRFWYTFLSSPKGGEYGTN